MPVRQHRTEKSIPFTPIIRPSAGTSPVPEEARKGRRFHTTPGTARPCIPRLPVRRHGDRPMNGVTARTKAQLVSRWAPRWSRLKMVIPNSPSGRMRPEPSVARLPHPSNISGNAPPEIFDHGLESRQDDNHRQEQGIEQEADRPGEIGREGRDSLTPAIGPHGISAIRSRLIHTAIIPARHAP